MASRSTKFDRIWDSRFYVSSFFEERGTEAPPSSPPDRNNFLPRSSMALTICVYNGQTRSPMARHELVQYPRLALVRIPDSELCW